MILADLPTFSDHEKIILFFSKLQKLHFEVEIYQVLNCIFMILWLCKYLWIGWSILNLIEFFNSIYTSLMIIINVTIHSYIYGFIQYMYYKTIYRLANRPTFGRSHPQKHPIMTHGGSSFSPAKSPTKNWCQMGKER